MLGQLSVVKREKASQNVSPRNVNVVGVPDLGVSAFMRLLTIVGLCVFIAYLTVAVEANDRAATPTAASATSTLRVSNSPAGQPISRSPDDVFMPVDPNTGTPEHSGRLIVMFSPEVEFRASRIAGVDLYSMKGKDVWPASSICMKYAATIRQAINVDPTVLEDLKRRAEAKSRRVMPDLASMMYLEGIPSTRLVRAGQEFLTLPEVAWVEIERKEQLAFDDGGAAGGPPIGCYCSGCDSGGGDCIAPPQCWFPHPGRVGPTFDDCVTLMGWCTDPTGTGVCGTVLTVRPSCGDGSWDEVCATFANLLGPSVFGGSGPYDTCLQDPTLPPLGGWPDWSPTDESVLLRTSPFFENPRGGSINAPCCRAVCFEDVTCCTVSWDANCTAIAVGLYDDCYSTVGYTFPGGGGGGNPQTPNKQSGSPLYDATMLEDPPPPDAQPGSAPLALYTTPERAPDPYTGPDPPPVDLGPFAQLAAVSGFRGGGLDIAGFKSLLAQFPGSAGPQLRHIKVAVVEPSALVNHEDLIDPATGRSKVTVEPGQTPLVINDQQSPPPTFSGAFYAAPQHGTATLGILFGNENEFGVTGIVPDADAYFFPTESFEEQGRTLTAMTNAVGALTAISALDSNPGNVIVLTFSEAGQPLTTIASRAAVISTGLALGVNFAIAAGNAAQEIDAPIEGTETAIVVGGSWAGFQSITAPAGSTVFPGLNYCRSPISNFSATNTVHIAAWGSGVCTLGYGDLFCGANGPESTHPAVAEYEVNRLRTYTATFGGTSAAAAQIGGVLALTQALAKQVYDGLPFAPENIVEIIADPQNKFIQCGQPAPTTHAIASLGDTLLAGDGEVANIGGFPNLRMIGVSTITGDFYDGNQSSFKIVCGKLISGTPYSIRQADTKFVKARTARPRSNQSSSGLGPPLLYPPSQRILDVQVTRASDLQSTRDLERIAVRVTGQTSGIGSAMCLVFLFNGQMNRWQFLEPFVQNLTPANATLPDYTLGACSNPANHAYMAGGSVVMSARVVCVPFGGLGQAQIWLDQVLIDYNSPLIPVAPPCP